jgi:hypothetical protein
MVLYSFIQLLDPARDHYQVPSRLFRVHNPFTILWKSEWTKVKLIFLDGDMHDSTEQGQYLHGPRCPCPPCVPYRPPNAAPRCQHGTVDTYGPELVGASSSTRLCCCRCRRSYARTRLRFLLILDKAAFCPGPCVSFSVACLVWPATRHGFWCSGELVLGASDLLGKWLCRQTKQVKRSCKWCSLPELHFLGN